MKRRIAAFGLFCLSMSFIICANSSCSSMSITGEWKDKGYARGPFKKFIVIGLFKKLPVREGFENSVSAALRRAGVEAISGLSVLTPDREIKKSDKDLDNFLHVLGVDGILILRLQGLDKSEKYVAGSTYYSPAPGTPFSGPYMSYYYNYFYPVRTPGYYEDYFSINIDCSLFANDTNKMIWKAEARSIPFDQGSHELIAPRKSADDLARIVVGELRKNGYITSAR